MEINTDFIGPIMLRRFLGEKYFFIFTDEVTIKTEINIGKEKSEWFEYLQTYYF